MKIQKKYLACVFSIVLAYSVYKLYQNDLYIEPQESVQITRSRIGSPYIAHALGGLNGETYLNCKQCFLEGYKKGFRYFEADFMKTSDDKLVLFHDGHEERFSLPMPFSEEDFFRSPKNNLGLLNIDQLAALMLDFSDWYLVTDIKDNNLEGLKVICKTLEANSISCAKRVIPQIYQPEEMSEIASFNFERVIFTLYRFRGHIRRVENFVRNHPHISALTIPKQDYSREYLRIGQRNNIDIFVHTLNDEDEIKDAHSKGAYGIYTDTYYLTGGQSRANVF